MKDYVILVDALDNEIGQMPKLQAHKLAKLHRAFSVFIFNDKNEMLLQQRAEDKYHSSMLWTNACCSHPKPKENILDAAHRRIKEEMGIYCNLQFKFKFIYNEKLENGLTENELDHVFVGKFNGEIYINPIEVNQFKWISIENLKNEIKENPEKFTIWFLLIINNHLNKLMS